MTPGGANMPQGRRSVYPSLREALQPGRTRVPPQPSTEARQGALVGRGSEEESREVPEAWRRCRDFRPIEVPGSAGSR